MPVAPVSLRCRVEPCEALLDHVHRPRDREIPRVDERDIVGGSRTVPGDVEHHVEQTLKADGQWVERLRYFIEHGRRTDGKRDGGHHRAKPASAGPCPRRRASNLVGQRHQFIDADPDPEHAHNFDTVLHEVQ